MSDYVYLKNLNGQQIKPVTDLAAINMTTTNGIGVSTVNGGTIGIIDGYIESAYYTEMADPAVGAANVSSAYVDGGTAVAILGAYTVASAVDTAAPSQQKVPSEKAVVDALNNVVVSGVSYYAGTGINIDQGHTVSVANVPQSSVAGLENTLTGINTAVAAKQDAISAGYRMSLDGTTLNQKRYFDIESPTSTTITLQAGHAYKITATNSSKTLDSEQIPANQFGLEGHAEIFVAGTGLIKTTSNVVLAQALEPDAVNNCTVRFHDGKAIISVEDHVAGYIVISASGTTAGTLPYALSTASNEYISFDASLNNITLDLAGATTYAGEKHVVGNGYTETIISGGVTCTSKTTFSNLSMLNVAVNGGTMTLGDVYIPSGATVSVSGGGLAIEKVSGNGVIDLGGKNIVFSNVSGAIGAVELVSGSASAFGGAFLAQLSGAIVNLTSTTISGNTAGYGGAFRAVGSATVNLTSVTMSGNKAGTNGGAFSADGASVSMSNCIVSGNSAGTFGGGFWLSGDGVFKFTSTAISGNTAGANAAIRISDGAGAVMSDCVLAGNTPSSNAVGIISGTLSLVGSNAIGDAVTGISGTLVISSGATVDLTGNTNAIAIAPGGGITIPAGAVVTILGSGGSSGYFSELALTGSTITNTGRIYGATVTVPASGGPWEVNTTEGDSTLEADGTERQAVISGGVSYIGGL